MIAFGVLLGVWLICGIIAYGLDFAFFQRAFPRSAQWRYWSNLRSSLMVLAAGWCGLLAVIIFQRRHGGIGRHGFKLW